MGNTFFAFEGTGGEVCRSAFICGFIPVGKIRFGTPARRRICRPASTAARRGRPTANPFEMMRAIGALIGGGVLEKFPRLRVAFLEAGAGWLPYWMGGLDGAQGANPEV